MLDKKIIEAYSSVHSQIIYTNDESVSFDGSQKQKEFFAAWNHIEEFYKEKQPKKLTFLEVGAWKGLWGIAFAEFCKLNNIEGEYLTLTMIDQDPNNQPLFDSLKYIRSQGVESNLIDTNTMYPNARDLVLEYGDKFDMVFIDAGHKLHEVMNDIEKFADLASDLLIFHDIRPIKTTPYCGVYEALEKNNIKLDWEIAVAETEMGIGIKHM